MIHTAKNNRQVLLRKLTIEDLNSLVEYFQKLSTQTLKRYGPHGFDKQSVTDVYSNPGEHFGYIALDAETREIVAYSIIKPGCLQHDGNRLRTYGIAPAIETDCSFAPSVADAWQSMGVGNALFHFLLRDLRNHGFKRIILWGGVQSDNQKALNYYTKNGFRIVGNFEFNGPNYDMILDLI